MKFFHISDLHLGKYLNDYKLYEDQKFVLGEIIDVAVKEKPDAVLIAGDVYDRAAPSGEAVTLFDSFITKLAELNISAFIISGNHDSCERLSFGSDIMKRSGIYLSKAYSGQPQPVSLKDEYGEVRVYLLPFVRPSSIRSVAPDEQIDSYTDAIGYAVKQMNPDTTLRNVIVSHQFVTGAQSSGSEESIVAGGLDNVDVKAYDGFDYVALGHIHGAQSVGRPTVRYCGTPLKYSASEINQNKSLTIVEMKEKGRVDVREVPLVPLWDLVEIKGRYEDLIYSSEEKTVNENYVKIVLTDEKEILDALAKLRTRFKRILSLEYENRKGRQEVELVSDSELENKSAMELVEDLYAQQLNCDLNEEQKRYLLKTIDEVWGDAE